MELQIAQVSALVLHGNARLAGRTIAPDLPARSWASPCRSITFCDALAHGMPTIASGLETWFDQISSDGTRYLQLHHLPRAAMQISDRLSSGFVGGGGRWCIEQNKGATSDWWEPWWENSRTGWVVDYGRFALDRKPSMRETIDLDALARELVDTLQEAIAFSRENDLTEFEEAFGHALEPLIEAFFDSAPVDDILPDQAGPLSARRLLAAAHHAWVFGGEDNWNEVVPKAHVEKYEPLSDKLYRQLIETICAATNAGSYQVE